MEPQLSQIAQLPLWVEYAKALGTPAAAILAAGLAAYITHKFGSIQSAIARQQAHTARNKLKLDLFDRRYAVYNTVIEAISQAGTSGHFTDRDAHKYIVGVSGSEWLFDQEVNTYLNETLWQLLIEFQLADHELTTDPMGVQPDPRAKKRTDCLKAVIGQHQTVTQLFRPHLQIET